MKLLLSKQPANTGTDTQFHVIATEVLDSDGDLVMLWKSKERQVQTLTPSSLRSTSGGAKLFANGNDLLAGSADYIGQLCYTLDGAFSFGRTTAAGGTHGNVNCLNDLVFFKTITPSRIDTGGPLGAAGHWLTQATLGGLAEYVVVVQNNAVGGYHAYAIARRDGIVCAVMETNESANATTRFSQTNICLITNAPGDVGILGWVIGFDRAGKSHGQIVCDPATNSVGLYGVDDTAKLGNLGVRVNGDGTVSLGVVPSSSSGLAPGTIYADAMNGNVLKTA